MKKQTQKYSNLDYLRRFLTEVKDVFKLGSVFKKSFWVYVSEVWASFFLVYWYLISGSYSRYENLSYNERVKIQLAKGFAICRAVLILTIATPCYRILIWNFKKRRWNKIIDCAQYQKLSFAFQELKQVSNYF